MCYLKLQVPLSNVRIFINKFQQLIIMGGYSKLYNNIAVVTRTQAPTVIKRYVQYVHNLFFFFLGRCLYYYKITRLIDIDSIKTKGNKLLNCINRRDIILSIITVHILLKLYYGNRHSSRILLNTIRVQGCTRSRYNIIIQVLVLVTNYFYIIFIVFIDASIP